MKRKVVKLLSISVNNMRMTTALFRPWLEILTFPIWLSSFDENNGLLPNKRNRADGYRKGKVHKFGHSKLEILFSNQSKLSKIFLKYKGKLKIENKIKNLSGSRKPPREAKISVKFLLYSVVPYKLFWTWFLNSKLYKNLKQFQNFNLNENRVQNFQYQSAFTKFNDYWCCTIKFYQRPTNSRSFIF